MFKTQRKLFLLCLEVFFFFLEAVTVGYVLQRVNVRENTQYIKTFILILNFLIFKALLRFSVYKNYYPF